MNILLSYTLKSLRANRTRTLVTIIGIVLSMALTTAVIEGAYSGQQFMMRYVLTNDGSYAVTYRDITEDDLTDLTADSAVKSTAVLRQVGWAELNDVSETMRYLLIKSMSDDFTDVVSVNLTDGRMPQNSSEILLPSHLPNRLANAYPIGSDITLNVGARMAGDTALRERDDLSEDEPEHISDAQEMTFTVVGYYASRHGTDIENYHTPGYVALTTGLTGAPTAYIELNHPSDLDTYLLRHDVGSWWQHSDLVHFSGDLGESGIATMLYGFAGILVFLVALGSISLIYNSFSISVSERTRQFGIFKSVGATKKQIRRSVIFEALILCAIAIPIGLIVGCVGIGLTLYFLRDSFNSFMWGYVPVQMHLVINPTALAVAALVCLVVTLISVRIPARRAMATAPMDAIRQSNDIKIAPKEVRTNALTGRLFGFEATLAAKNFKRNRRRYRSTIISLMLSVTLFVSASSFCAYLTNGVNETASAMDGGADLRYYVSSSASAATTDRAFAQLSQMEGVTDAMRAYCTNAGLTLPANVYAQDMEEWGYAPDSDGNISAYAILYFLDDAQFDALCAANGLNSGDYRDPDHPRLLGLDEYITQTSSARTIVNQALNADRLPVAGSIDGQAITVGGVFKRSTLPYLSVSMRTFIGSMDVLAALDLSEDPGYTMFYFSASDHAKVYAAMTDLLVEMGLSADSLTDAASYVDTIRMVVMVISVFANGFIILISLIAAANVFNTISTNISLRRREIAMLRSVGLSQKGFQRMMNYECLIYGLKGLLWGLPAAVAVTFMIWMVASNGADMPFYLPWHSVALAVGSVFAVVFASMLYAAGKIRHDNPAEALKGENI